jgi:hypothetical protein
VSESESGSDGRLDLDLVKNLSVPNPPRLNSDSHSHSDSDSDSDLILTLMWTSKSRSSLSRYVVGALSPLGDNRTAGIQDGCP